MWNLRRKDTLGCSALRDALESASGVSALPASLQQHLAGCPACRVMTDEFSASRTLLGGLPPQRYEPSAWFVGRVMAAISAREAELRRTVETWSLIPRLAAKFAWVSALALLVAGSWLYERPKIAPNTEGSAGESLFEAPSPAAPDDLLATVVEHEP